MDDNHHHGRITAPLNSFGSGARQLHPEGRDVLADLINWTTCQFNQRGDARRLVACWNALVGIDTALIEDGRLFASLVPPAPCDTATAESFMDRLNSIGWSGPADASIIPVQRLVNGLLQEHAPAAKLSQDRTLCSRSIDEQDRSYAEHGGDYKARMVSAFAFSRQLEIELRIARDLLRQYEEAAAAAPRVAPAPIAPSDLALARSEGAKP